MNQINLFGTDFKILMKEEEIISNIKKMAKKVDESLKEENPLFLIVLKGAAMFGMELLKALEIDAEMEFIRAKSYIGMESSGTIACNTQALDVKGRHIIIVEDIVDTGNTIEALDKKLLEGGAKKVEVATLFFKPEAYKKERSIEYIGAKIPSEFVVGFGLDYDEKGRGLRDLYVKV